ncbi:dimethyladenosine transferase [Saccharomonospora piscinae]|uniref:Dimethyladenosine transferase n=1 Tax=Saccharomonospora piscinae TaxID=687388 RepID=A0A1V9A4Y5_SACPI|nr:rRNA adenine dimethyltransferase family protein [Saccharomonospora piscinae]OQO92202.1 dimethyladenosine transferase [Saccharomonospora piscinae]TLW92108.1 methyltransferase domain-containing protein [Saccharomonospora piscinae]
MPQHRRPSRHTPAANPSGVHFLVSDDVLRAMIRTCAPGPGDLVVDVGAGPGVVTAAVARTGARVIAVERDPDFVRTLRTRFRDRPRVRVVGGDLRTVPLPRRDFLVVANPPYAVSTALLRRLLGRGRPALRCAALTVEWGLARRVTAPLPRSREVAQWACRFDLTLVRRVPARCFRPTPTVDSAVLAIRRRPMSRSAEALATDLLDAAWHEPSRSVRALLRRSDVRGEPRLLRRCGIEPGSRAATVPPGAWAALAVETISPSARRERQGDGV